MKNEWNNLDENTKRALLDVAKQFEFTNETPSWYDNKNNKLDEVEFCTWFISKHPLKYVGGIFYDIDGIISEEKLKKEIVDALKPYVKTNIVKRAKQILDALRYESMCEIIPKHTDRIHFKNGTYFINGGFVPEKEFCSNRLPVNYNSDAIPPTRWLRFLDELLYPEDIYTLQEFMGYILIPTTKAQAMLLLIGNGGEGKSRVGFVCRNLLGNNMTICSISTLANNKFSLADQEGMLLMIDDDMKMEALTDTGVIKAVVTMEDKMNLERKGKQSYQGYLNVRIMAFGNGSLSSLYDKSDGFYRRQITIRVKEKSQNRVDDRNLSAKLSEETEGIALWCLEGLKRLIKNEFHFTISERTLQNQAELRREEDSILDFFESEGYITFDKNAIATTKELYEAYCLWGNDNLIKIRSESSFSKELRQRADKLGLKYLKNASIDNKTARGYKGICAIHTLKDIPFKN
ncbi:putative DNA primase/helicase [Butyrivibrio hungatei]|uniref:Putative DNA primase/helicase n=1 Tax=Butyrivibrio hungatei TaxID=185008 RepID=A0A1G5GZF4_9FIRM|nr:phage/plasmid primase, P4 family [Butyrivibrio hungatei]SCY56973.1 putative DNA primase/helicase [Butyrivibrio hungatei]